MFPNFCFSKSQTDNTIHCKTTQYAQEPKANQFKVQHNKRTSSRPTTPRRGGESHAGAGGTHRDAQYIKYHNRNCPKSTARRSSRSPTRLRSTWSHVQAQAMKSQRSVNFQTRDVPSKCHCSRHYKEQMRKEHNNGYENEKERLQQQQQQQRQRDRGGHAATTREHREHHAGEAKPRQQANATDTHKELQDTCTDFLNIVHDNVLETVQKAVERLLIKFFEHTQEKMNGLAGQLVRNEALLSKTYLDVLDKINEQSDSSLNQFKFMVQLLMDLTSRMDKCEKSVRRTAGDATSASMINLMHVHDQPVQQQQQQQQQPQEQKQQRQVQQENQQQQTAHSSSSSEEEEEEKEEQPKQNKGQQEGQQQVQPKKSEVKLRPQDMKQDMCEQGLLANAISNMQLDPESMLDYQNYLLWKNSHMQHGNCRYPRRMSRTSLKPKRRITSRDQSQTSLSNARASKAKLQPNSINSRTQLPHWPHPSQMFRHNQNNPSVSRFACPQNAQSAGKAETHRKQAHKHAKIGPSFLDLSASCA